MELVNTNICHHNEIQIVPKLKRKPELLDGRKDHNLVYITSTYSDFTFVFLFLFECPYIGIVICNHKKIINLNLDFCDFLVKSWFTYYVLKKMKILETLPPPPPTPQLLSYFANYSCIVHIVYWNSRISTSVVLCEKRGSEVKKLLQISWISGNKMLIGWLSSLHKDFVRVKTLMGLERFEVGKSWRWAEKKLLRFG